MAKRHLVILDVDGTLVHSLEAEALLFPRACEQVLGVQGIPSGFEAYRCPSDRGIVRELVESNFGRDPSEDEHLRVEQRFLELISDCYARKPELCRPVSGAIEAVSHFRRSPDIAVSIATAGWCRTALHKLNVAGISVDGLPIATSNDAERKADIMRIAADRASTHYGVNEFETVVCFGDSRGDARAASELGYEFIGIDTSESVADEEHTFDDFGLLDDVVRAMRTVQQAKRANPSVQRVAGA